ncbi:calpain, putative; cysteine peptidase, Clan CA, family C2, putative [Trypanosoma brucei brucei TREU927]|uniref:Calpain, putative cysteine peptidase, Clan CA, family C2, putative n=1 Tax=Trypanosoma brucei brucei (strain 927/4 GUTat10.1) TaxID=185431 RepID=Q4GZ09_TRYB2|nr:calpain; cysteine peptidase, Clan CA, family C2 [Trypanosoma brucei brucei TREU927]CAJ16294.1 calpain, putative; cysteine peptidase, Clan CA, family C2, putative [Trypanosoma brucei brucei TREU927]
MGCGASSTQSEDGMHEPIPPMEMVRKQIAAAQPEQNGVKEGQSSKKKRSGDDPPDEFEELTVTALPQRWQRDSTYKCGYPMITGDEVKPCFEKGLLYRIVKGDTWAFYNDTRTYEMCVSFTFGRDSTVRGMGNTVITNLEGGEILAEASIYPCETAIFVRGRFSGFRSKIKAQPLSDEILKAKVKQYDKYIQEDLARVNAMINENDTDDAILAKCVEGPTPFIDIRFPPNQTSIERGAVLPIMTIPWARPDMYLPLGFPPQVRLFRSAISTVNIEQGDLGDYWIMCAIASLEDDTERLRGMFRHPVSCEKTAKERAVGAYRVTLNKSGWWHSVIVDDYLPVVGNRPKFAQSLSDPCEVWVSILQKAYAKVHGSYVNIVAGDPLHALQDFTGYISSRYDYILDPEPGLEENEILERLEKYDQQGFKIILSTHNAKTDNPNVDETYREVGLLAGHAYPVKAVRYFASENIALLQIRNPWCRETEWKGEWANGNAEWKSHPEIAKACEINAQDGSSFWMSWGDVQKYFNGCGVLFRYPRSVDYRVRGVFRGDIPSVSILISVNKTISLVCSLTQEDRRGTKMADDYPPIMLSLCGGDRLSDDMEVEKSTTTEADYPGEDLTFVHSRDVGMMCTLTPFKSPYLLVPRIITGRDEEHPYVIGLLSEAEFGADLKAEFFSVPANCEVFRNAKSFAFQGDVVEAKFQVRTPDCRFPTEYNSTVIVKAKKGDWYVENKKK